MSEIKCTRFGCRGYEEKIGVLISQLGTPDAPTPGALRRYLRQFLSDRRVIEVNPIVWWPLLNGIILNTRPRRSARLYARIWKAEGSPLLLTTNSQAQGVLERLLDRCPGLEVAVGMRYGEPSNEAALDDLMARGCRRIVVFPMYPQYAAATTGSTCDAVFRHLMKQRWVPSVRVAPPYFRHPRYLQAQAQVINEALARMEPRPERLILSYHGVPEACVEQGDPYCCMCSETTEGLMPLISMPREQVLHTYQSRFGRDPWLTPYTDETIEGLATQGIKHIAVACPGFTADCLETLDEIGNEAREAFCAKGGETLRLISCLNDHPAWLDAMAQLVWDEIGSWVADRSHAGSPRHALECPTARAKSTHGAV